LNKEGMIAGLYAEGKRNRKLTLSAEKRIAEDLAHVVKKMNVGPKKTEDMIRFLI
jgi:hypothetical protein